MSNKDLSEEEKHKKSVEYWQTSTTGGEIQTTKTASKESLEEKKLFEGSSMHSLFKGDQSDIDVFSKLRKSQLEFDEFKIRSANETSERELRERNATLAFIFSSVWGVFIICLITSKVLLSSPCPEGSTCVASAIVLAFGLSSTEFMFIIGTMTTSIFGFYLLVLKYLFDKKAPSYSKK
ncbi:hypothetical protein [Flammeovirga aprica]|uniref:Uncharacterized protein n=1 Tax=Flammeovirga aprica JL-4 TaxID=694437 RepID=A0A7X9P0C2_9BACT|nr:hypothetical protein [Flammeovirga aprica]NME67221.1 hypothetical protein [Flammeovirga aprica JL-4]